MRTDGHGLKTELENQVGRNCRGRLRFTCPFLSVSRVPNTADKQPFSAAAGTYRSTSEMSPKKAIGFMPLVIIAFRNKDGGISGCNKKSVPKSERFFDNRYIRAGSMSPE
jgi:hypothetical protein